VLRHARAVKSPKNYLLLLLVLSTVGVGALAWQQYQELITLRAASLSGDDRDGLLKRLAAAEKRARDLESQLAAAQQSNDETEAMAAVTAGAGTDQNNGGRPNRGNRGQGGQFGAAIRALMDKPEVQQLRAIQQKAMIDARYAALFKSLNLSSDQADKVKGLLADRQTALQDVRAAALEQGINPRTDPAGYSKLVSDAQADINNSIKATIGDTGFAQLQQYDQTMPQRNLVNQLQQNLSYTGTPLTDAQAGQLVDILAANAPQRGANGTGEGGGAGRAGGGGGFGGGGFGGGGFGGGFGGGGGGGGGAAATITPAAVNQASSVLAATQLQALQQLQQVQQAQQQMQQLIRQTIGAGRGNGGTTGTAPAKKSG
jgi:hypothetical protein